MGRPIDGSNIEVLLKGGETNTSKPFFYCKGELLQAVRKGKWKLRLTKQTGYELFDLDTDPGEMLNLAQKKPHLVDELLKDMVRFTEETDATIEYPE